MLDAKFTQEGSIEINANLSEIMPEIAEMMHESLLDNLEAGIQGYGSSGFMWGGISRLGGRGGSIGQSIWHANTDDTASAGGGGLPYSYIHNYGGEIRVTERSKRFFWYKFMETGDEMWKAMALKKVGSTIHIPERKYIGFFGDLADRIIDKLSNFVVVFSQDGKILND